MRTWMITGISSGFGYEFAKQLLATGERVIGTVRRVEAVKALQKNYPNTLVVRKLDIRDYDAVEAFVKNSFEEFKVIDVVLSNSGIGVKGAIEEVDRSDIEDIISINLMGCIILIRACVPYLKSQGHGQIVQMSSKNGRVPADKWAYYCATKYGINGFCETLAVELEPWNIQVNIIEPGDARTDYWGHCKVSGSSRTEGLVRYGQTAEIDARKMVRLLIGILSSKTLPLHIVIGEVAYARITDALRKDLRAYVDQRQLAKDAKAKGFPKKQQLLLPESVGERRVLMWGLGEDAGKIFHLYDWSVWDRQLYGFLEKDMEKVGKIFIGREIFSPSDIEVWNRYFVIVATNRYYKEIKTELEKKQLTEGKDFCHWKKLRKE